MILAYHLIMTAYGFWLPNDPRGSWSDFVWSWELAQFGPSTKVTTRASLARRPHDIAMRLEAKNSLNRTAVNFTGIQARAIGRGFARAVEEGGYVLWACSILPRHVHAVVARHPRRSIERIGSHLKSRASTQLVEEGLHPFQNEEGRRGRRPTPWTESLWPVYLDSEADIHRAIAYVENNPVKEGLRAQRWSFLTRPRDGQLTRPKGQG